MQNFLLPYYQYYTWVENFCKQTLAKNPCFAGKSSTSRNQSIAAAEVHKRYKYFKNLSNTIFPLFSEKKMQMTEENQENKKKTFKYCFPLLLEKYANYWRKPRKYTPQCSIQHTKDATSLKRCLWITYSPRKKYFRFFPRSAGEKAVPVRVPLEQADSQKRTVTSVERLLGIIYISTKRLAGNFFLWRLEKTGGENRRKSVSLFERSGSVELSELRSENGECAVKMNKTDEGVSILCEKKAFWPHHYYLFPGIRVERTPGLQKKCSCSCGRCGTHIIIMSLTFTRIIAVLFFLYLLFSSCRVVSTKKIDSW